MKRISGRIFLALLLAAPAVASADTLYTSASAFDAATSGVTTVTFDGVAPSGSFITEPTTYTLNGATFSSVEAYFNVTDPTFVAYESSYAGGDFLGPNTNATTSPIGLMVSFAPSTAVSFDFGGLFGPTSIGITLSDGYTTTLSASDSIAGTDALDFAGITSSTPITSISFELPTVENDFALDNISYGDAVSPVPEPSSLLLALTGLAGAAGVVRRRLSGDSV